MVQEENERRAEVYHIPPSDLCWNNQSVICKKTTAAFRKDSLFYLSFSLIWTNLLIWYHLTGSKGSFTVFSD